jgi:hypothetical protein
MSESDAGVRLMRVSYRPETDTVGLNASDDIRPGGDPDEEIVAQIEGLNYLKLGNLITVFILLALLRIFASLDSRIDISLFWEGNLCEEGFSNSNCLIITVKFLIDLISLISSIARLRLAKRLAVDVGSIWGERSITPDTTQAWNHPHPPYRLNS